MPETAARICRICGASTNYAHFGVESCRACADFYKRSTLSNKEYSCRQGNGQCKLSKSFICRRCRFEKCKALGMTLTGSRKMKTRFEEELPAMNNESIPSTSSSASPPSEYILTRIARERSAVMARKKSMELALRPTALREHVRVEYEGEEELMLCTWSFLMDCLRMYAVEFFSLAGACFPESFLLQSCGSRVYILESHYLTAKVFKSDQEPLRACMTTQTTCLDRDNIHFFIKDSNPVMKHDDIVISMTYYINRLGGIVWPLLIKSNLTETEFNALFGLVVWQMDPSQQYPDWFHSLSAKIRNDIFADLRRYYCEELNFVDYSVRLGNLTMLEHTIQEANSLKAEEMQTYNLLNMLQADVSFLQLVLQIVL